MTLFQPLWPTRPSRRRGSAAGMSAARRKTLAAPTVRERLFVAAAEAFFADPRVDRLLASHPAMGSRRSRSSIARFPTTRSGGVLRARAPRDRAAERGIAGQRDAAAARFCSASTEESRTTPARCTTSCTPTTSPAASASSSRSRKYDAVAPGNPHALHMPTHIYTRLGEWNDVIGGNLRAADGGAGYAGRRSREVRVGRVSARGRVSRLRLPAERRETTEAAAQINVSTGDGPSGAQLQDGVSSRVHPGSLCARAAGLERGGARSRRATGDPRLGRFPWAGGDVAIRARTRGRAPGASRRSSRRRPSGFGAGCATEQGGRGALCAEHPHAALEVRAWLAQAEATDGLERRADAGRRGARGGSTPKHRRHSGTHPSRARAIRRPVDGAGKRRRRSPRTSVPWNSIPNRANSLNGITRAEKANKS